MATKQRRNDIRTVIHGENTDNKVEQNSSEKCADYFQYRVSFKSEWGGSHPVKTIKNEKYKFHCLPYGESLFSHHFFKK